ncbi:MAG: hypothetical protein JXR03_04650 [Cyclobacteriaceae bacterium]
MLIILLSCGEETESGVFNKDADKQLVSVDDVSFTLCESVNLRNFDLKFSATKYYPNRHLTQLVVEDSVSDNLITLKFLGFISQELFNRPPDYHTDYFNFSLENINEENYDLRIFVGDSLEYGGAISFEADKVLIDWSDNDGIVDYVGINEIVKTEENTVFGSFVYLDQIGVESNYLEESQFEIYYTSLIDSLNKMGFMKSNLQYGNYTYFSVNELGEMSINLDHSFSTSFDPNGNLVLNYRTILLNLSEKIPKERLDELVQSLPKYLNLSLVKLGGYEIYSSTSGF